MTSVHRTIDQMRTLLAKREEYRASLEKVDDLIVAGYEAALDGPSAEVMQAQLVVANSRLVQLETQVGLRWDGDGYAVTS